MILILQSEGYLEVHSQLVPKSLQYLIAIGFRVMAKQPDHRPESEVDADQSDMRQSNQRAGSLVSKVANGMSDYTTIPIYNSQFSFAFRLQSTPSISAPVWYHLIELLARVTAVRDSQIGRD